MVKEHCGLQMETNTLASGKIITNMASAPMNMQAGLSSLVNGSKTKSMAKARSDLKTVISSRATTIMELSMVKGSSPIKVVRYTKGILVTIRSRDLAATRQQARLGTLAAGLTASYMVLP